MKRIASLILIISVLFSVVILPSNVEAETLADLRSELATLKKEQSATNSQKNLTQSKINQINKKIAQTGADITACEEEIEAKEVEIEELGISIEKKDKEIKEIMQFYQIASSEDFYLNYIFGAEDYTDFIYRYSISEQLASRNQELMEEMEDLIVENKSKIIELGEKTVELEELTVSLQSSVSSLGNDLKSLVEDAVDIADEIKSVNELISFYVSQGCKENEEVSKCVSIPYDTEFIRPLKKGVVTSEFGSRFHPIYKVWKFHAGIDLGGNGEGTAIYAAANGRVAAIIKKTSCGGNRIYIHHNINGTYYTTAYLHVLAINVSVGDIVTQGQKIATVGGGASTKSYDKCSTGAHLHFETGAGLYFGSAPYGYSSYSTYVKKLVNPRTKVYFPKKGTYWYSN